MYNIKDFVKNNYVSILILILFIFTRLVNFTDVIRYESGQWVLQIMQFITIKGQIFNLIPHFPLAVIFYKAGALFFGNTIFGVNLIHFLLNLLTFIFVYKTSLLFYNDKKVANWSILLYTISFYAYAGNTMGIDQDLALNPLLFILTLYLYKKYSNFSLKGILLTSLSCGLLTISRPILGVIVMGIIFIDMMLNYIVNNRKKIKFSGIMESILKYLKLFIPYLIIGGIFCYFMYRLLPSPVIRAINTYKSLFSGGPGYEGVTILTRLSFLGQVFLYTSPLILAIIFLFKNFQKHQIVIISSIVMILYMCMGTSGGDPARWLMPILPIFVIEWGYLCTEYINKKNRYWILLPLIVLLWLNYFYLDYSKLPLNISDYLNNPLNKIFILTTTIFSPIYLNSKLVFGIAGFSIFSLIFAIISKNKIYKSIFMIFSIGVNLFFVLTNIFQIKQPDISNIGKQMYEFCAENCDLNQKIYTDQVTKDTLMLGLWDKYIGSYFNLTPNIHIINTSEKLLSNPIILTGVNLFAQRFSQGDIIDIIEKNGTGFIFMTHYLGSSDVEILLDKYCSLEEKFYGNNEFVYGIVYRCKL